MSRVLIAIVVTLCAFSTLPLPTANAQSSADRKQAEVLFHEGKALMKKKEHTAACSKFRESYELGKGLGSQYFLARCLTELNQTATAYKHYLEVADISARAGQQERAEVAKERLDELEPRLMKIQVDVTARAPDLEIRCDGQVIPEASWGTPIAYDPGAHVVTANIPDRAPWQQRVQLKKEGTIVRIVVPDLSSRGDVAPGQAHDESTDPLFIAGLASGGLGIISLAIGGGLAAVATSTYDDSDEFCDDTGCDEKGLELVADARDLGVATSAMLLVGGALFAGGGAMIVIAVTSETEETALFPEIRWGLTGASFHWRF